MSKYLDKSSVSEETKYRLAGRFRKRKKAIAGMYTIYKTLCIKCQQLARLKIEKGESILPEYFCEDCQDKIMPLLGKIKEKMEK